MCQIADNATQMLPSRVTRRGRVTNAFAAAVPFLGVQCMGGCEAFQVSGAIGTLEAPRSNAFRRIIHALLRATGLPGILPIICFALLLLPDWWGIGSADGCAVLLCHAARCVTCAWFVGFSWLGGNIPDLNIAL